MRRRGTKNADVGTDEVEEMLRAAEDDLLLNLTRNTHATHKQIQHRQISSSTSVSVLDSDLDRRFEALKSTRTTPTLPSASSSEINIDTRFEALKGAHARSPTTTTTTTSSSVRIEENPIGRVEEGKSKNEVEEILQWALDSVRLGSTENDVDGSSKDSDEEESDDDDDGWREEGKRVTNR